MAIEFGRVAANLWLDHGDNDAANVDCTINFRIKAQRGEHIEQMLRSDLTEIARHVKAVIAAKFLDTPAPPSPFPSSTPAARPMPVRTQPNEAPGTDFAGEIQQTGDIVGTARRQTQRRMDAEFDRMVRGVPVTGPAVGNMESAYDTALRGISAVPRPDAIDAAFNRMLRGVPVTTGVAPLEPMTVEVSGLR